MQYLAVALILFLSMIDGQITKDIGRKCQEENFLQRLQIDGCEDLMISNQRCVGGCSRNYFMCQPKIQKLKFTLKCYKSGNNLMEIDIVTSCECALTKWEG